MRDARIGIVTFPGSLDDRDAARAVRRSERPPAIRVDARAAVVTVTDAWAGSGC